MSRIHPVIVWIKGGKRRGKGDRRGRRINRGVWDEEKREEFRRKMGEMEEEDGSVQK